MVEPVQQHIITSPYGWRQNPLGKGRQFHDGIDFISPVSTEVFSVGDGVVCYDKDWYDHSKRWTDNRHSAGNMVIVRTALKGNLYYVRYLHIAQNYVEKGQRVSEGQSLGAYGDVGKSTGPHLHLDMYDLNWKKINPTGVLNEIFEGSG